MEALDISQFLTFGKMQKLLFVLCGGGWAIAMGVVGSIAVLINELHEQWKVDYSILSIIPICNMTGIFIGSNIWGMLTDRYGRMIAFKRTLLVTALALIISVFSVNVFMLAAIFLFVGFGLAGSLSVDGAVFLEYCPKDKTYLLTGMSVVCAFGGMYATGSAWLFAALGVKELWRYVLGVNAGLCILACLPRFWVQETPLFLASRGRFQETFELLSRLNKGNVDENALRNVITADGKDVRVLSISEQVKVLFQPPLKRLIILYLLVKFKQIWSFTAFTFNAIGTFIPEILKRSGQGSQSNESIYMTMFIQNLSSVPGVLFATYLVNTRMGRKWTQAFSLFMACILLYSFLIPSYSGVTNKQLITCSTIYFFFINTMYPVQYAITPETFPIQVRNTAVGLCNCVNNLASIIGPFVAAMMLENISQLYFCLLLFSCSLFLAAACSCLVLETKGFNPQTLMPDYSISLVEAEKDTGKWSYS
jgi:putative MFS transporter